MTVQPPPTPVTVTREFTSGEPGKIPVSASVVATLPTPVAGPSASNLSVSGFYTANVPVTVGPIAAGGSTGFEGLVYFTPGTNLAGKNAFPASVSLSAGQSLLYAVNVFWAFPIPPLHLIMSSPSIKPYGSLNAWYITGPITVSNPACTFSFAFGTDATGYAGGTLQATVQCVVYGNEQTA